jgi:hypothetical protein
VVACTAPHQAEVRRGRGTRLDYVLVQTDDFLQRHRSSILIPGDYVDIIMPPELFDFLKRLNKKDVRGPVNDFKVILEQS